MTTRKAPLYAPALRMKAGELEGVRLLADDVADCVLPRFIVPPFGERDPDMPLPLSMDRVPDISVALSAAWRGRPALIDATYILDEFGLKAIDLDGALALGAEEHLLSSASPAPVGAMPKNLPVYGTALGCDISLLAEDGSTVEVEQTHLEMTEAIDFLRRPAGLANRKDAYALIVVGASMAPRYDDGDTVIVDPRRQAVHGQDVVVQLRNGSGHDGDDRVVSALIKRMVRRSASWI